MAFRVVVASTIANIGATSLPEEHVIGEDSWPLPWRAGNLCPAGGWWDLMYEPYAESGFDWIGEKVAVIPHIGEPQACCNHGGGSGEAPIGLWYSLCTPRFGCHKYEPEAWGNKYYCTVYMNVTGKRPEPGMQSGFAQAPVNWMPLSEDPPISSSGTNYQNPFSGSCGAKGDVNMSIASSTKSVPGHVCAPSCTIPERCPTDNMPPGTTAVPQCVAVDVQTDPMVIPDKWKCALACDPTGGSTLCPAGASCKELYPDEMNLKAGQNPGVCTYDGPTTLV